MPSLPRVPFSVTGRRRDAAAPGGRSPVAGTTVVVTGAAQGIGAELSRRLVAAGAQVVALDVDADALEALGAELGDAVLTRVADVTDLASVEAAVADGVERFGGVDTVVANAGIGSFGSVLKVDPAAFRRVIDVNVTGVFHTVRAALPHVIERRGYVLVVSSLSAFAPAPGMASYTASKAGAENFATALHLEVAHLGVAVGSAHMCWVDTPMVREARADLRSFDTMISKLPPPLNRTTSVESCVDAFVAGIEGRARRVYVPGWVGAIAKGRSFMQSRLMERETLQSARTMVDVMDGEAEALGRSLSARYAAPRGS